MGRLRRGTRRLSEGHGRSFPSRPFSLELLIAVAWDDAAVPRCPQLVHTLDRMAIGGIYDQVGGGFHRYSTDQRWLVPHFEKMLYDNAQLTSVYAKVYELTGEAFYGEVVEETLDYVLREMTSADGAFYSAQDAEANEREGGQLRVDARPGPAGAGQRCRLEGEQFDFRRGRLRPQARAATSSIPASSGRGQEKRPVPCAARPRGHGGTDPWPGPSTISTSV